METSIPDTDERSESPSESQPSLAPRTALMATPDLVDQTLIPKPQTCDICYNLGSGLDELQKYTVERHLASCKIGGIRRSAAGGCSGCALLEASLAATDNLDLHPDTPLHIIFHLGMPLRLESSGFDVELFLLSEDDRWPYIGSANAVPAMLDAKAVARLARSWLQMCQESHPICLRSSKTRLQGGPRRLIQLLPDGQLRLVSAANIKAPYVALSYCWGAGGNYITTRETLGRTWSINYQQLPKTIRDAIDITRQLEIDYIWIDSICIVQDDEDSRDWREESANMDIIYEGAVITLSATRSASVETGFIGNRERQQGRSTSTGKSKSTTHNVESSPISHKGSDGSLVDVFVRHRLPHDAIIPEDGDDSKYPILTRGWTFQERLLATRTIHFLPHEIVWECRCEFWCECTSSRADLVWKKGRERGSSYNKEMGRPETMNSTLLWQSLVQQYSNRQLTVQSDRLPALSGIARRIRQADPTLDTYLAGLWEKDLVWHLLWQVDHAKLPSFIPGYGSSEDLESQLHEYLTPHQKHSLAGSSGDASHRKSREPTWSWISTPWPVKWPLTSLKMLQRCNLTAKAISGTCVLDPINPLGDVTSGEIKLETSVFQAKLLSYHEDSWKLGNASRYIGWQVPDALDCMFIPDGTFDELGLVTGDIIDCALIMDYTKDSDTVWIALGLRRLDVNSKPPAAVSKEGVLAAKHEERDAAKDTTLVNFVGYGSGILRRILDGWAEIKKEIAETEEIYNDANIRKRWEVLNQRMSEFEEFSIPKGEPPEDDGDNYREPDFEEIYRENWKAYKKKERKQKGRVKAIREDLEYAHRRFRNDFLIMRWRVRRYTIGHRPEDWQRLRRELSLMRNRVKCGIMGYLQGGKRGKKADVLDRDKRSRVLEVLSEVEGFVNHYRPVYRPEALEEGLDRENYYRVGIVTGKSRKRRSSTSLSHFGGIRHLECIIT